MVDSEAEAPEEDGNMRKKGVSPFQQKFAWIFLGKRLLKDEKYTLRCSRCNAKMQKVQKKNTIIDLCPHCGGIFLDHGEINKLVKLSKKETTKKKK